MKAHHKSPLPAGANLRTALAAGPPIQAIFSIIPAIEIVEMIGLAGFTAVILDMEHGPYDIDSIGGLILAARARASMPVARVRRLDAALIGAALDAGAAGVLVPQITSPAGAAPLSAPHVLRRRECEALILGCERPISKLHLIGSASRTHASRSWS